MDRITYYKITSKYIYYFCIDRLISCHRLDLDRDIKINWRHPRYWSYNNLPKDAKPYLRHIDLWDSRGWFKEWIIRQLRSIYCSPYYFEHPRYELEYPNIDYNYWDWVIDIDFNGDLEKSKEIIKEVREVFKDYGVKDISIKFSGCKGFHIWINVRQLPNEILCKGFHKGSVILTKFLEFKVKSQLDWLGKETNTGFDYSLYRDNMTISAPFSLYYKDVEGNTPVSSPIPINKVEKFRPIYVQKMKPHFLEKLLKRYGNFGAIKGDLTEFVEDALRYYHVNKKPERITIDIGLNSRFKIEGATIQKKYSKKEYIKTKIGNREVIINKAKLEEYFKDLVNSTWTDGKMRGCYYLTSLCKLLGYNKEKAINLLKTWAEKYGTKYSKKIEYEVQYLYDREGKVCSIKWIKENIPEAKTQIDIFKRYYEHSQT